MEEDELWEQLINKLSVIQDKVMDDDEELNNICNEMWTIINQLRGNS